MVLARNTLKICNVMFISATLLFSTISFAKAPPSPLLIKGTQKITAQNLIQLAGEKPNLIIIDSRIKSDRHLGYIEGSISLPDENTSCLSLAKVIKNKVSPVAFYCNGPNCGRSAVAVKVAIKCGYTNTYWFRGGFETWQKKNYPFITD